jgi:diguanylate cyclase (GGDEF)-like protein
MNDMMQPAVGEDTPTILLVDDSSLILNALENAIKECCQFFKVIRAVSLEETETVLRQHTCHVAVVDVNLPDAPFGEAIDRVTEKDIPVIVLTGTSDENVKNIILQKEIYEFVSKNQPDNIRYVAQLAKRIIRNFDTNVLVVDDSAVMRLKMKMVLEAMHLNVIEAEDPIKAMDVIEKEDISLVLTDYEMPNMNGLEFVFKLREGYRKDQLMIIAISSIDEESVVTKFLKHGANDYILKPFSDDELEVRVMEKLSMLDMIRESQERANRDFLTGMYNRRYFFEAATPIFKKTQRREGAFAVAMVDIDHFKKINDTYGHDVGDIAIRHVASILFDAFRSSDLIARFGGEEFCLLLEDISLEDCRSVMEKLRKSFQSSPVKSYRKEIPFTASIGVCYGLEKNLDAMIKVADEGLYIAKAQGRNQVIINKGSC